MAKRPIGGMPPGVGEGLPPGVGEGLPPGVGEGFTATRPTQVQFDEFDLDVRFGTGQLEPQFPVTGCLCLGGTEIDTVGGATCGAICIATRDKWCLSNYRCITIGNNTCFLCATIRTCRKVTACLATAHGTCLTCGCATNSGVECG